ncbi:MAG: hypothetical protein FJ272_22890, partial [Planctomycetes bacterium]|nr:hypothetical protein [Planctomycetota bacterium]
MTALVPQFLGMALLLISWPLGPGLAAMPSVERLDAHEAGRLWEVAGGALEAAKPDLLRWQP